MSTEPAVGVPTDEDVLVAVEEALEGVLLPDPGFRLLEAARNAVLDAVGPLVARLRQAPAVPVPPPTDQAAVGLASVRPQTLANLATHLDARAVAILRPESEVYAEWQTVVAWLRRLAAEAPTTTKPETDDYERTTGHLITCLAVAGGESDPDCDACNPKFGVNGCTCIPWTRQGGKPRLLGPGDTVDMIGGWERGLDCPHHAPAVVAQPGKETDAGAPDGEQP